MKLPRFGASDATAPQACDAKRNIKPLHIAFSALTTSALVLGGNLPTAIAADNQTPDNAKAEQAGQTEQADQAGLSTSSVPNYPFAVQGASREGLRTPLNASPGALPQQTFDRFIVSYTDDAKQAKAQRANAQDDVAQIMTNDIMGNIASVSKNFDVKTEFVRTTATEDALVKTSKKLSKDQAQDFMKKLAATPGVASVEPDYIDYAAAKGTFDFNDPHYSKQWNLTNPRTGLDNTGAALLRHGAGATVAVLDTGYTNHPDLKPNLVSKGYDFISDATSARDGNGRDANALDEGDSAPAGLCGNSGSQSSSWHGTHVSGIIAARGNNKKGVVGVADKAGILPVRVLGRCGGSSADIADAIVWAAGGKVQGVPANRTPAKILNLSLGGNHTCTNTYQRAIDIARSKGAIVVVAAGNSGMDAANSAPANCKGVVAVGNSTKEGRRAPSSNYGRTVAISAPGTDILSLGLNSSDRNNGSYSYVYMSGTSMAAPHVAGVLAEQMVKGNKSDTKKIYNSIFRAGVNPISCDRSSCGRGIINSRKTAQWMGYLNKKGKKTINSSVTSAPNAAAAASDADSANNAETETTSAE